MSEPCSHPARLTQEAAQWHALQREGRLSAEQQAQFMRWLVAAPEHLGEYLAVARIGAELSTLMRGMEVDLDALLADAPAQRMSDNVVALPIRRPQPQRPLARPRRRLLSRSAIAATLLLGLGVAMQALWPQTQNYAAGHGAPRSFELPDHTVVHLNAESELSIHFSVFRRRVELSRGQASFIVADERRPFAVHAAGLQVQDIGTTFDVSLWREQARVDVAEGRVRVFSETGNARLLADLGAGESARVDYRDHTVSVSREDVGAMTAWWGQRIVFHDQSLRDVADQFNRLNRVRLQVDDEAAGALRLTGNLRGDDLASLRAFLDQHPSLRTTVVANRIRVGSRAPGTSAASAH